MPASPAPDQPQRRQRLAELLDHPDFGGVQAELARFLGLKSGAYIRQLLEGERPITEKLIDKIEAAQGGKYRGWFAEPTPLQYSAEALELAAIYDRVDARDRMLIRALVLASESAPELPTPPDDLPSDAATPMPGPAR